MAAMTGMATVSLPLAVIIIKINEYYYTQCVIINASHRSSPKDRKMGFQDKRVVKLVREFEELSRLSRTLETLESDFIEETSIRYFEKIVGDGLLACIKQIEDEVGVENGY